MTTIIDSKLLQSLPNDVFDRIFKDVMKDAIVRELEATEMHGHDERISIIKSIKHMYEINREYWMELDEFMRNELITYGFGPGEVFEPLIDALRNRLSWRQLCKVKPPYSCCGWGVGGVYNIRDLRNVLCIIDLYHPGIPINGWDSGDEHEPDTYYTTYVEFEGTFAKK